MDINAGYQNSIKNRLKFSLYYYNLLGKKVHTAVDAVKQQVCISFEQYMKSLTEDYEETSAFGEGEKFEYNIFNNSVDSPINTVTLEINDGVTPDDIVSTIKKMLVTNIDFVDITVTSPSDDISFTTDFVEYLFATYKSVSIDLASSNCWLTLPNKRASLDRLSIKNSNLIFTEGMYEVSGTIDIDNCAIKTEDSDKQVTTTFETSGQTSVSNIFIISPVSIGLGTNSSLKTSNWTKTSITISNVNISFKDIESRDCKPILNVYGACSNIISGIKSVDDVPGYPLIALTNGKDYSVTDLSRQILKVSPYTYTVGLIGVQSLKMSNFKCLAPSEYDSNGMFFKIYEPPVKSEYSLTTFELSGINFGNFKYLTLNKLIVSDGFVKDCTTFANMEGAGINKLSLSKVAIDVDDLYLKSADLFIDECNFESPNISVINDGKTIINSSELNSSEKLFIDNKYFSSFNSDNTKYYGENIHFTRTKTNTGATPEPVTQNISFKNCQIYGDLVSDSMDMISLENALFDDMDSLSISGIPNVTLSGVLKCRSSAIDFKISGADISGTQLKLSEIPRTQDFVLDSCTGNATFIYLKDCDENNLASIIMKDCVVSVVGTSMIENQNRRIKFNSTNSQGSTVFGSSGVTVTPDYPSTDNNLLEYSDGYRKDNEKIYYGKYE